MCDLWCDLWCNRERVDGNHTKNKHKLKHKQKNNCYRIRGASRAKLTQGAALKRNDTSLA